MMFDLMRPDRPRDHARYSGVAAGPAEQGQVTANSAHYLADIGSSVDVVARVAGVLPPHEGDQPDTVRQCLRTVDDGLALCCPLPVTQQLRLGAVIHLSGTVTGQRTQGTNYVTEVSTSRLDDIG